MEIIQHSNPDEAVLIWLKAELNSSRFSEVLLDSMNKFGLSESQLNNANLDNEKENELRYNVLLDYRPWFKEEIYAMNWSRISLDHSELLNLRYIDYSYWNEISNNSRLVGEAAKNVQRGKTAFDVSNDNYYTVAKHIANGGKLPPLILVADSDQGPFKIVEGHVRATGMALASDKIEDISAILGVRN